MDEIEVVDYDPDWPNQFGIERRRLKTALAQEQFSKIEHFGSTAVAGLAAKPIIDILIAVPSIETARSRFRAKLETLDYVFWQENPKPDRLFFVKGMPPFGEGRTHHVHVSEPGGEMWEGLKFRDYLASHPDESVRYAELKKDLALKFRADREAYTRAKDEYIGKIMVRIETRQTR